MIYTGLNETRCDVIKAIVKPNEYIVLLYARGKVEFLEYAGMIDRFEPKRGKNIDVDFDDPFYELTEIEREE